MRSARSTNAQFKPDVEMTIYTAADNREALLKCLKPNKALTIDMANVGEIDSAGVQLLLVAQRFCAANEQAFHLQNPTAAVVDVIELCGLSELLSAQATPKGAH